MEVKDSRLTTTTTITTTTTTLSHLHRVPLGVNIGGRGDDFDQSRGEIKREATFDFGDNVLGVKRVTGIGNHDDDQDAVAVRLRDAAD